MQVGFHLIGTTDSVELPEPVLCRLACLAFIQWLPDSALADALSALTDSYEMNRARLTTPRSHPEPEGQPVKARFLGERVESYPDTLDLE